MLKHGLDETGKRYGRLVVEKYVGLNKYRNAMFQCICDCGERIITRGQSLRDGTTKSCGCLQRDIARSNLQQYNSSEKRKLQPSPNKSHGMSKTKLYKVWLNIKRRCYDEKHDNYPYYGGRGITVCDEWIESFEVFRDWAFANGYSDGLTIDRIDPDKNYEPSNCRWIPFEYQSLNKRNTLKITFNGETKPLKEWCKIYDVNYKVAHSRYKKGWPLEEVLSKNNYLHRNGKTFEYKQS